MTNFQAAPAVEAHATLRDSFFYAAIAIGRHHSDDFPGLLEFVQDQVLFVVGRPAKNAHGWIAPDSWRNASGYATEIYISADARGRDVADLAAAIWTTITHELAHAVNFINGVQGLSRQGRWHNRNFAEVAIALGLEVEPHPSFGHVTPNPSAASLARYAEEIDAIENALVLAWAPNPKLHQVRPGKKRISKTQNGNSMQGGSDPHADKYVCATCLCVVGGSQHRTIRVASGSWAIGPIHCPVCATDFVARSL